MNRIPDAWRSPEVWRPVVGLLAVWVVAVVVAQGLRTGAWLTTIGQTVSLFGVTGLLAYVAAKTDNLVDRAFRPGDDDSEHRGGGPSRWTVRVPVEDPDPEG